MKAVGLDQSSPLGMSDELAKSTVLILSANMGYADMTLNFLCRLREISKTFKYIVFAQDPSFYKFLQWYNIPSVSGSVIHRVSTENDQTFRSTEFNQISIAKMIATRIVLELGYNVLFSDVDIAWKKNPMPFLAADVDLTIQSNSGTNIFSTIIGEPNTGFYFIKSNDRSMALLDHTIKRARDDPSLDDQSHFGSVLQEWHRSRKAIFMMEGMSTPWIYHGYRPFTFRLLHPYLFQTGQVAFHPQKLDPPGDRKDQDIVLVHANFMVGHSSKVDFFKQHALWHLKDQQFIDYLVQWKSNNTTNKQQNDEHPQMNYQLALDTLSHVCVD